LYLTWGLFIVLFGISFQFWFPRKNSFVSRGRAEQCMVKNSPPPNAADALFGGNPKGRGALGGAFANDLRCSPETDARYGFALAP
jgi:hypothetical protein